MGEYWLHVDWGSLSVLFVLPWVRPTGQVLSVYVQARVSFSVNLHSPKHYLYKSWKSNLSIKLPLQDRGLRTTHRWCPHNKLLSPSTCWRSWCSGNINYTWSSTSKRLSGRYTCVSVPVLSEKTYSIWPNSSFSVVVLARAGVSVSSWYIFRSQPIRKLMANRITSTLNGKNKSQTGFNQFLDLVLIPDVEWDGHDGVEHDGVGEEYEKWNHGRAADGLFGDDVVPWEVYLWGRKKARDKRE